MLHAGPDLADRVRDVAPNGVDHIVEVAFGHNLPTDLEVLALGGSIATFATDVDTPAIPFWPLLFKNIRVFFVGSDDVPVDAKRAAAIAITDALVEGWTGFDIAERWPLEAIATAHEYMDAARETRADRPDSLIHHARKRRLLRCNRPRMKGIPQLPEGLRVRSLKR